MAFAQGLEGLSHEVFDSFVHGYNIDIRYGRDVCEIGDISVLEPEFVVLCEVVPCLKM